MAGSGLKTLMILMLAGVLAACATPGDRQQLDLEQVQREAALAYQQKRYDEAERKYRLLTERVPTEAEPWFRLGNIYARSNRPEQAARAYHEAVVREPALSRAWYNLSIVRLRQAGNALVELTRHALPDDPLNARAERLANGLFELLGEAPARAASASGADGNEQALPAGQAGP
ncbi:MAG: tetratricopeptide repeat protein [Gammaproteobacteria bacterium]|nr:MAG: tetratricopeptide repeat protein [Gammaproteobacteria bacterium]